MFLYHRALYLFIALATVEAEESSDRHRIKPRSVDNGGSVSPARQWPELIRIHDPGSRDDGWAREDLDHTNWQDRSVKNI